LTYTPLFNAGDLLAGKNLILLDVQYAAADRDRLFYEQSSGRLLFRRRVASTNYDAAWTSPSLARGVPVRFAVRWASSEAEEDMVDRQVDLFANGVKVGSVVASSRVDAFPSVSYMQIGADIGLTLPADGRFSGIEVRDYVMSAAEVLDLHG